MIAWNPERVGMWPRLPPELPPGEWTGRRKRDREQIADALPSGGALPKAPFTREESVHAGPLSAFSLTALSWPAATTIASPAARRTVVSDARSLFLKARCAGVCVSRARHFSAGSSVALVVGIDAVDEMQIKRRQVQHVARLLDDLVRGHAREARELGQPRIGPRPIDLRLARGRVPERVEVHVAGPARARVDEDVPAVAAELHDHVVRAIPVRLGDEAGHAEAAVDAARVSRLGKE